MLKVTVELWPGGRESGRRVIAAADIGRIRDGAFADYRVRLEEQLLNGVGDEAVVADYPRWSASVWNLVARCRASALNDVREALPPRPMLPLAPVYERDGRGYVMATREIPTQQRAIASHTLTIFCASCSAVWHRKRVYLSALSSALLGWMTHLSDASLAM